MEKLRIEIKINLLLFTFNSLLSTQSTTNRKNITKVKYYVE